MERKNRVSMDIQKNSWRKAMTQLNEEMEEGVVKTLDTIVGAMKVNRQSRHHWMMSLPL
jgi:hypothetical protein